MRSACTTKIPLPKRSKTQKHTEGLVPLGTVIFVDDFGLSHFLAIANLTKSATKVQDHKDTFTKPSIFPSVSALGKLWPL